MKITTVGIDLAKNVFQIHGVDQRGKVVVRKRLRRQRVLTYFAQQTPCLVGMEACGGAHYWARKLQSQGHTVKLMAPQFVKPYVKANKTDAADTEAICEAVTRPSMRFVEVNMKFLKSLFGCVLLLGVMTTLTPTASAQTITSVPISSSDGVYLVTTVMPTPDFVFTMNDLLLVHPDSVILVDNLPPGPGFYSFFANEIHTLTAGEPVDTLINTSWHFDHVGLNAEFTVLDGTSTIIAHSRAGDYMDEMNCIEEINNCMPPLPEEAQPTEGIRGVAKLLSGGETITLKTVEKAHSGADLVIYLEEANVVHTGDIYFGGMYPIIDLAAGGTVNGMLHGLNQILDRIDEDTIVVPSHGVVGSRQSVVEFASMLKNTRKLVRELIAEGLTEQQVMIHPSFAALDVEWGNGFIPGPIFRLIVYRDLASHRGGKK